MSDWIDVKDRLPDFSQMDSIYPQRAYALVVYEGHVYKGSYLRWIRAGEEVMYWSIPHIHSSESLQVTHWMPLPEPPTK